MTAQSRLDRVFESLDDMGEVIYRNYMNGNKSDARMAFKSCPADRRAYLAYTIIGRHMTTCDNPRVIDFDDFFKSITV